MERVLVVDVEPAMHRLTGRASVDLAAAAAAVTGVVAGLGAPPSDTDSAALDEATTLLDALVVLHWMRATLTAIEPALIAAARAAGASWQDLAPTLGVASRQAAERRYLRLTPATPGAPATREGRVQAERTHRAGTRAVNEWANTHTAELRRLAGQITALTDLDPDAVDDIDRLHHALADRDAVALPALLAETRRHLHAHAELADQVDAVDTRTRQVRHDSARHRASGGTPHRPHPGDA